MKKRLLTIFLSLAVALSVLPGTVLAVETGARDTEFFTDREHADLDFSELEFRQMDADAVLAGQDAVRELLDDRANTEEVRTGFTAAAERFREAYDMYILAYIFSCRDVTDTAAAEAYQSAEETLIAIADGLNLLAREILESPCAAALDGLLTEQDREELLAYEAMTEMEMELQRRETALVNEYWASSAVSYSTLYDGRVWDDDSAREAYQQGTLDAEAYLAVSRAIAREKNAAQGSIYLELVELRRQTAELYGYDTYSDYAYENIYQRDYTPAEIRVFHAAVKEYIVPLYQIAELLFYDGLSNEVYLKAYDGEAALDAMEPAVAQLSDELLEAFSYMRDHGLYDIDYSATKANQGYTAMMPGIGAPFFYDCAWGDLSTLTTAVHEFGHYNNYYWQEQTWDAASKSIDVAEVHSQGLELLFTHYYPDIFGDGAGAVEMYIICNILYAIVQGALYDELQQYVYATEGVTLEQINAEYCRLCKEYGMIDADDPRTEMYGWVDVHHNFESPCYYISYAVSAAGAFAFWLDAQENYEAAVDGYLSFVALDLDCSLQESFAAVEMENPLSAGYLEDLAGALGTRLEAQWNALPAVGSFTDVHWNNWYCEAVDFVYTCGLFSGVSDTLFDPNGEMSRAMAVTVLYRLMGSPDMSALLSEDPYTDVDAESWYGAGVCWAALSGVAEGYGEGRFGPADSVTREQLAVMFWRCAGSPEAPELTLVFSDAKEISAWAEEAVRWAVSEGILNGRDDGTLDPGGQATRAQTAQMLMNWVLSEAA